MKKRKTEVELYDKYYDSFVKRFSKQKHDLPPSYHNKMMNYFMLEALYYKCFRSFHKSVYEYLVDWARTTEGNGIKIVTTNYESIRVHSLCSLKEAQKAMKDLVLFGFIKIKHVGNGFSKFSEYEILTEEQGKVIRENNKELIVNRRKCDEKG